MASRSSKPDTWMPFYIGDYLADTQHLTTIQHGAYILLLITAWKRGGLLPNDDGQLAAIARVSPADWKKMAAVIRPFFKPDGHVLVQKRLTQEYLEAVKMHSIQVTNGKKGGRPPNSAPNVPHGTKPKDNPRVISGLAQEEPKGKPKPNPEQSPSQSQVQETKSKEKIARKRALPPDFSITDRVRLWATANGHARLDERLEHFIGYAKANGKTYLDWDQAFMNAIRENWAKLGATPTTKAGAPDTEKLWADLRTCNRNGKVPENPLVLAGARAIGGMGRLGELSSYDIDRLRPQFDEAVRKAA